jgi:RNA polymerase sigma-70 factor (ECF subfamily)
MPSTALVQTLQDTQDGELLRLIGGGDQGAFRELYQRYAGRLLAYVRAMGRQQVSPEDAVQEVFATLWTKAAQYRPELGAPEAWIFTITRHKVFDIWRAQSRVGGVEVDLETLVDHATAPDPTLVATLHKALSRLSSDHRKPLLLAYFGGYTYEETARALGIPAGTLKSRIRTALADLRTMLGSP